jgi:hypothetical protein
LLAAAADSGADAAVLVMLGVPVTLVATGAAGRGAGLDRCAEHAGIARAVWRVRMDPGLGQPCDRHRGWRLGRCERSPGAGPSLHDKRNALAGLAQPVPQVARSTNRKELPCHPRSSSSTAPLPSPRAGPPGGAPTTGQRTSGIGFPGIRARCPVLRTQSDSRGVRAQPGVGPAAHVSRPARVRPGASVALDRLDLVLRHCGPRAGAAGEAHRRAPRAR